MKIILLENNRSLIITFCFRQMRTKDLNLDFLYTFFQFSCSTDTWCASYNYGFARICIYDQLINSNVLSIVNNLGFKKWPRDFQELKINFNRLYICRFIVGLIDFFGIRKTTTETQLKQSVIKLFVKDAQKTSDEMEEFEFELLKAELLTQPIEKEGNQLFHRKVSLNSSWIKSVSGSKSKTKRITPNIESDYFHHMCWAQLRTKLSHF